MKIIGEPLGDIHVNNMAPGSVAVITNWGSSNRFKDVVVKMISLVDGSRMLVAVGLDRGTYYWDNVDQLSDECRVKLLEAGTKLEL